MREVKVPFEVPDEMEVGGINWDPRVGAAIKIYVDGEYVQFCTYYSIPKGEVHCHATDRRGHYILSSDRKSILTMMKRGKVTIGIEEAYVNFGSH